MTNISNYVKIRKKLLFYQMLFNHIYKVSSIQF